ncbi:MAG TPA: site-specific integrase, partial [Syntrophobacteraceae bacterium]|nr:site-specific integrase [Syntrophobacteraceae bacterium]
MSGQADSFEVTQGRHGPIWKIAKGVRVYKSPDGTFEIEVPEKGKRKRRRVEELEQAIEAAKLFALRAGLPLCTKEGKDLPQGPYLFEHAAWNWFALNKGSWTAATIEKYQGLLRNHILPAIGNLPLLEPYERWRERVKKFLVDLREIRSAKMVEVAHAVISGVFSEAIDSAKVQINPAQGLLKRILPPKKRRVLSKPDPFSKSDLRAVLDSAWKVLSPDRAMAIEVMAKTGMRVGECLAMHIDNLDIRNRLYWIKEKVRHGKWGVPKDGEDRQVDISEELMTQLQAHLKRLKERMLSEGKPVG